MIIAHTADWHLGVSTHSNPGTGLPTRTQDSIEAIRRIIDKVAEEDVDLLTISGDIFHTTKPSPNVLDAAYELYYYALETLGEQTQIITIAGNHDNKPADGVGPVGLLGKMFIDSWPYLQFYESVNNTSYNGRRIDIRPCEVGNECPSPLPGKYDISLCHAFFEEAKFGSEGRMMAGGIGVLSGNTAPLVLAGHIHKPQKIEQEYELDGEKRKRTILYPGSPMKFTFDDRKDERGFWLVDYDDDNGDFTSEFINVNTRPMVQLEIDSDDISDENLSKCSNADVKIVIKCNSPLDVDLVKIKKKIKEAGAFYLAPIDVAVRRANRARDESITVDESCYDCLGNFIPHILDTDVKKSVIKKEAISIMKYVMEKQVAKQK